MSNTKMQYGWVCPVCGRGLSPSTSACPCKDIAELFSPYQTTHPRIVPTYCNDWRYIDSTTTAKGNY